MLLASLLGSSSNDGFVFMSQVITCYSSSDCFIILQVLLVFLQVSLLASDIVPSFVMIFLQSKNIEVPGTLKCVYTYIFNFCVRCFKLSFQLLYWKF